LILNVEILGEYKKLTTATKGAQTSLKNLEKRTQGISRGINTALGAIGVGFTLSAVINAFEQSTKAAIEDRKSKELLSKALEDNLRLTDAQVDSVEKFISKTQLATSVADDQLRPAFQKLAIGTKDVKEAQDLLSVALDVSAGTGKNLDTVAQAMAKALEGNTGALARLVPSVKNAKDPMQTLADTFDGAAEAAANTDPYAQMQIIFGEMQEQIGTALLPILDEFSQWLKTPEGQEKLQEIVDGIVDIIIEGAKLIDWIMDVKTQFDKWNISIGAVSTSLLFLLNSRLIAFAATNPTMAAALAGIGLIAAGMWTVYENTKRATDQIDEFQRLQSIQRATSNPVVTPEELNAATYKGILEAPKTPAKPTPVPIVPGPAKPSTVPKTAPPSPININVSVKKSIASGPDIAKAINASNRNLGTQTIKNLKY
jgi:hypothetical protein